jgi:hypothetical protein
MDPEVTLASRFPSELGVHGTMRLPNRKEELAQTEYTPSPITASQGFFF